MTGSLHVLVDDSGNQFPIGPEGITIGRQRGNQIVLTDSKVSRRHAIVRIAGQDVIVIDQASANGTYINGKRIAGQAILSAGSTLQVGSHIFRLAKSSGQPVPQGHQAVKPQNYNQRTVLVFLGGAVIVLIVIIFALGGGRVDISRYLPATSTFAPTAPPAASVQIQTVTITMSPTTTQTPVVVAVINDGSIGCTDLDLLQARHDCSVTNLGTSPDNFWISFINMREVLNHGYALSVVLPGMKDPTYPNRRGRVSLGSFQPGETRQITVQMYCVEPASGCPDYDAQVQLLVEDGFKPIFGVLGEFVIRNNVAGTGVRATRRPADTTSIPSQIFTPTPSDLGGGTSTP